MFNKKRITKLNTELAEVKETLATVVANATDPTSAGFRARMASALSGGYDGADTLHNIYLDFGYPETLSFANFWNMYRRFGIAKNVVELPVEMTWMRPPTIESEKTPAFNNELEKLITDVSLFQRLKGLDTRQRVGRYAGMFMRVKDGKKPDQPIEGKMGGAAALMSIIPLYESQLEVLTINEDPTSERYTLPKTYQFNGSAEGSRNEKSATAFTIHWTRVVPAAEGADNGSIYGIPALEAVYNSLMDLRKIIGGGGEGFYKNASQNVVFELADAASAKVNAPLLEKFNEHYDDFAQNRMRRAMWTPGLKPTALTSDLIQPKEFFTNALNDVAAGSHPMIPSTLLVGSQTGRLASQEDSRGFLAGINARQESFGTSMVRDCIDWFILNGILPAAEYEVEWDDLLALSDTERMANAVQMADTNAKMFQSGVETPFTGDEVREAAGFEAMEEVDEGGEGDVDEDGEE